MHAASRSWLLLIGSLGGSLAAATTPMALIPTSVKEDFEANTLAQFASYPPVQDIGYDPSITPITEFGSSRALMRIFRAPGGGDWPVGFIRRFDLASNGPVRVQFAYRVSPVFPGTTLEVGIAGADGRLYRKQLAASAGGNWANAAFEIADMPAGTAIDAVYIVANLKAVDPNLDYRFVIDNLAITAAKPARFETGVQIAHWKERVSTVNYAPGETIAIEARASVPVNKVTCTLKDQDGNVRKTGAPARDFYTLQAGDPPGFWRAELRGQTADGHEVATDLRILVRANRTNVHPRLHFTQADKPSLLARTQDAKYAPIWKEFVNLAKSSRETGDLVTGAKGFALLDTRHLLPTLFGYFSVYNRADSRILNNALVGAVTSDGAAVQAAKQTLLDVATWPKWVPPWFEAHGQHTYYPAGELAATAAFAYDVLYDSLSPAERSSIRAAVLEHGIKASFDEYVADNRLMAGTSNWIGHTVGGALSAIAALDDGSSDPQLNTHLGGLLLKMEDHLAASYLKDGSYGEGISYQEFDLKTTAPALTGLRNTYGIDYWKHSHVLESLTYPLYALAQPPKETLDMGDTHAPTGYSSASIVAQSKDPAVHWYFSHLSPKTMLAFLYAPQAKGEPPQETSRLFPEKGAAIFRTGWTADDAILNFRAGANHNHNHADQGSFLLRAFGEELASEAGFAGYYKDPYYLPYFTQAAGHNTVLVNGDNASQDIADTAQFPALQRMPKIESVALGSRFDAVSSQLAPVYRGKLRSYKRRLQFLKPNYVVIYDELESAAAPAKFNWLLHVRNRSALAIDGQNARYTGAKASMAVRTLEPQGAVLTSADGHLPGTMFATTIPVPLPAMPGFLDVATPNAAAAQRFLVVLAMDRNGGNVDALASQVTRVSGKGCIGARLGNGYLAMFRQAGTVAQFEDWTADAASWSVGEGFIAGEAAQTLTKAGKTIWKSDARVSFSIETSANGVSVYVDSPKAATIEMQLEKGAPRKFEIAAGRHRLRFDR